MTYYSFKGNGGFYITKKQAYITQKKVAIYNDFYIAENFAIQAIFIAEVIGRRLLVI